MRLPKLFLLVLLLGCRTAPASRPEASPPGWLTQLPREQKAMYAVGVSGPTYYPEDAVRYAQEDGRIQLAHALASKVTAITVAITSEQGSYADNAGVVESATGDYTEAVVELSEVVATWVDRSGRYSGRAGTAYALVRIDLTRPLPAYVREVAPSGDAR